MIAKTMTGGIFTILEPKRAYECKRVPAGDIIAFTIASPFLIGRGETIVAASNALWNKMRSKILSGEITTVKIVNDIGPMGEGV